MTVVDAGKQPFFFIVTLRNSSLFSSTKNYLFCSAHWSFCACFLHFNRTLSHGPHSSKLEIIGSLSLGVGVQLQTDVTVLFLAFLMLRYVDFFMQYDTEIIVTLERSAFRCSFLLI